MDKLKNKVKKLKGELKWTQIKLEKARDGEIEMAMTKSKATIK